MHGHVQEQGGRPTEQIGQRFQWLVCISRLGTKVLLISKFTVLFPGSLKVLNSEHTLWVVLLTSYFAPSMMLKKDSFLLEKILALSA